MLTITDAAVIVRRMTYHNHRKNIYDLLYFHFHCVQIRIGRNLEYNVGTLMYTSETSNTQSSSPLNTIIGATVGMDNGTTCPKFYLDENS